MARLKTCSALIALVGCRDIYAMAKEQMGRNIECTPPFCIRDMCAECTYPSKFLWVEGKELFKVYSDNVTFNLPSLICLSTDSFQIYKRFDVFMQLLSKKEGREFASNVERQLRTRNVVLH